MNRSAPRTGYDFQNKREYRARVWKIAGDFCGRYKNSSHVLLMPSIEGTEIEIAKRKGFLEYNLHIVDKNPAIVATLKRHYPRINTYGVDVGDALDRIEQKGIKLKFAHFDLCSNVLKALPQLSKIADSRAFTDPHMFVINVMRGREVFFDELKVWNDRHEHAPQRMAHFNEQDKARVGALAAALGGLDPLIAMLFDRLDQSTDEEEKNKIKHTIIKHCNDIHASPWFEWILCTNIYKSNKVTMQWSAIWRTLGNPTSEMLLKSYVSNKAVSILNRKYNRLGVLTV